MRKNDEALMPNDQPRTMSRAEYRLGFVSFGFLRDLAFDIRHSSFQITSP